MIACRRFETLTLHQVTQEFRTADCEWLAPERPAYQVQRSSLSDTLKRRELLNEFIYWFFQSFLTQLLRVCTLETAVR
jgi:telomerase reverse transcriptase